MGRIAFGLGALASVLFLGWFSWLENENPGFSIPVGLIVLTLITTTFALSKVKAGGLTGDGQGAAWTALILALISVAYLFIFKNNWLLIAAAWAAFQVPGVIAAVVSPAAVDQLPSE